MTNAYAYGSNQISHESIRQPMQSLYGGHVGAQTDGVEEIGVGVNFSDETATFKSSQGAYRKTLYADKGENYVNLQLAPFDMENASQD